MEPHLPWKRWPWLRGTVDLGSGKTAADMGTVIHEGQREERKGRGVGVGGRGAVEGARAWMGQEGQVPDLCIGRCGGVLHAAVARRRLSPS